MTKYRQLYFAKLVLIVKYLCQHIGSRQQVKFRKAYYANILAMSSAQLKKSICDIALTIGLHPASLGVESEHDGRIYVPDGVNVWVRVAENMHEIAQTRQAKYDSSGSAESAKKAAVRACTKHQLKSEYQIPSRVMQVQVTKGTVSVVIVVEHRNLGTHLHSIRDSLPNALIIMVSLPPVSCLTSLELTACTVDARVL